MGTYPRRLFLWSPESRSQRTRLWHFKPQICHSQRMHGCTVWCTYLSSMRPSITGTLVVLVGLIRRLESVWWLSRPWWIVLAGKTEDREEVLASHVDAEGAARAQGLAKFQEFRETWIGKVESIQETLAGLTEIVNMQGTALKDLEIDVGAMPEELQKLGQVDDANRKAATQSVTHLQHKIESTLQDRLAAHQLL